MEFQIADYVLMVIAVAMIILGVFRGLSGTLAFFIALAAACASARFGWGYAGDQVPQMWMRIILVTAGVLIVFGMVRYIVAHCVHCLLDQPADAIFGALFGLAGFLLLVYVWTYLAGRVYDDWPSVRDCSTLIRMTAPYVG